MNDIQQAGVDAMEFVIRRLTIQFEKQCADIREDVREVIKNLDEQKPHKDIIEKPVQPEPEPKPEPKPRG